MQQFELFFQSCNTMLLAAIKPNLFQVLLSKTMLGPTCLNTVVRNKNKSMSFSSIYLSASHNLCVSLFHQPPFPHPIIKFLYILEMPSNAPHSIPNSSGSKRKLLESSKHSSGDSNMHAELNHPFSWSNADQ